MTMGSCFWDGSQQSWAFASQQLNLKVCCAFHAMDPFPLYDASWMLILKTSFRLTDLVPTTKHLQRQGKFDSGAELCSSGQYFLPFPVSESFLTLSQCPLCCYLLQQRKKWELMVCCLYKLRSWAPACSHPRCVCPERAESRKLLGIAFWP